MICALHKGAFNISTSSRKKWLGQSIEDVKRKVTGIIGAEDEKVISLLSMLKKKPPLKNWM
mgnify:FL=1